MDFSTPTLIALSLCILTDFLKIPIKINISIKTHISLEALIHGHWNNFFQKYQGVIEFHLLTCMVVIAKLWSSIFSNLISAVMIYFSALCTFLYLSCSTFAPHSSHLHFLTCLETLVSPCSLLEPPVHFL